MTDTTAPASISLCGRDFVLRKPKLGQLVDIEQAARDEKSGLLIAVRIVNIMTAADGFQIGPDTEVGADELAAAMRTILAFAGFPDAPVASRAAA